MALERGRNGDRQAQTRLTAECRNARASKQAAERDSSFPAQSSHHGFGLILCPGLIVHDNHLLCIKSIDPWVACAP